ncbi:rhomboid family intramembrane serine protease [Actinacidiphila yeochonensis]|uniref:rhomboid family intramembrane serine protease n=1 Tax=Actinacidiphila yeochonensis TaxID=89050 RepID=UPI000568552E|nr:rhomboid family intramembrane serine protease [Actinacidiphila yeochonensis]
MEQAVCCYRHPDRETGIRCTRCEKPICTACMISASVGFQCPGCVSSSGSGNHPRVTQARTVTGSRIGSGDPFLITKLLIGINVLVWLLELSLGNSFVNHYDLYAACAPAPYHGVCGGVAHGEWYRVITSAFLHDRGNPTHIGFNMLSLWWIGAPLEQRLGRAHYFALYLVSALGGSAAVLLLAPDLPTLGASGAIFGLFGATAVYLRRLRYDMRPILVLLALNVVFTFTWANVSWQAHLGGLVAGTLVAVGMLYAPRQRRTLVQWGTTAVVLALSLALMGIGVAQVTS